MTTNSRALINALERDRKQLKKALEASLRVCKGLEETIEKLRENQAGKILKNTCRQPEVRVNDRATEAKKAATRKPEISNAA